MPIKQMTYAELAAVWEISPEAARKKVEHLRLPRSTGNDGKSRVMIDLDEVQHQAMKPRSDRRTAGDRAEADLLRQHVATLQAEVDRLAALAATHRADYERERERAERAAADLTTLADRLANAERDRAQQTAAADAARSQTERVRAEADGLRAELAAWKARPWWQRALG
ncbi:hypothetical protein G4G93_35015 [Methylobacterium sp. DB0501]|uniref:hypothetical protein n=1 Tax=Methylobacterium sp. DB0501 TaxID=2709665 RepID=UPI0013EDF3BF|nr:hypothetical protein [Methylobacterium sp. DB0501]NGM39030.1 hypothetical protein [Methylobacterium sp. DB0501]